MSFQLPNQKLEINLGGRHYFLDWVRVLAFALLIFYHTGMMFVSWGFHIESGHDSLFLKSIMMLTSNWRLDILFLVSGVAISFMITKMSLKAFTWQRVIKLYIPFSFAVAFVVAPQSYYEALQKGVFDGSFWQFWSNLYFSFSWDKRMNAPFPTYNHLWYVLYLFIYTLLLLPLFAFINSEKGIQLLSILEDGLVKGSRIIWLPFVVMLVILFPFESDDISHALVNDWYGHYLYLLMIIMGLIFVRMPQVWQAFETNRYRSLTLGIISYLALLVAYLYPNEVLSKGIREYWWVIALVVKWSWISLLIGFSRKYLNYSNRALKYCNGIVYPFFILHQTVIIVFGYYVIDWGLSGISEYLIIVFGTFVICGLLCELFIKKIPLMRLLFGLKWLKSSEKSDIGQLSNSLQ